jgi:hypothetical protein
MVLRRTGACVLDFWDAWHSWDAWDAWSTKWTIIPSKGRSSLSLVESEDGNLVVNGLRIEAEASTVALGESGVALRRSSMILHDIMVPRTDYGAYVVDAGEASFVATIIFDGFSRMIEFMNADPIVFREYATGDWEFEPFDATCNDPGSGTWTIRLDRIFFRPIR